jgi:hypothetical protein
LLGKECGTILLLNSIENLYIHSFMNKKPSDPDAKLLSRYLGAALENTKDGGILRLKLPAVARGEILDLYLKLRSGGTKGGGVFLSTTIPSREIGEIADLYLALRAEGTKDQDIPVRQSKAARKK